MLVACLNILINGFTFNLVKTTFKSWYNVLGKCNRNWNFQNNVPGYIVVIRFIIVNITRCPLRWHACWYNMKPDIYIYTNLNIYIKSSSRYQTNCKIFSQIISPYSEGLGLYWTQELFIYWYKYTKSDLLQIS